MTPAHDNLGEDICMKATINSEFYEKCKTVKVVLKMTSSM